MSRRLLVVAAISSAPLAQAVAQGVVVQPAMGGQGSTPAPNAAAPPAQTVQVDKVSAYGQGSTRQIQSISKADMQSAAPGTSPLKVLGQLPGVDFQSADPFGAYEWSESLYIRGFNQSQLGFTLDDIPLGDQLFQNYNGLSIGRAIITDNIRGVTVSQGAGGVDTASTSNLGGTVQFYSVDVPHNSGGELEQTFGSNATYRTFARVDSGDLNVTGTRFSASFAHTELDKWKGGGGNDGDQVNLKLVQPLGTDGSTWTNYFDWAKVRQFDYQDLSLNYLHTLGQRVDNYFPSYGLAYQAALGNYFNGENLTNDPLDVSYYAGSSTRESFLGYSKLDLRLDDFTRWKTTFYGHGDEGFTTWTTPYQPSPNGAPLSERLTLPDTKRFGILSDITRVFGSHTIETGLWYEYNRYVQTRFFAEDPLLGQGFPVTPTTFPSTIFAEPWSYEFNTNTFQYHLQDTWQVLRHLTVQAGFRSLLVHTADQIGQNDPAYTGAATLPSGALTAAEGFLPQFGINWRFLPHNELFFDFTQNMRAFGANGLNAAPASPFGVSTQAAFDVSRALKPEEDFVYEAGYRYNSALFSGLLTAYRVNFDDRLQQISTGPIINPITVVQNVGSVTTNGIEASGTLSPVRWVSWTNSVSWNRSTFDNDFYDSAGLVPVRGKTVPNQPDFMYKTSLAGSWGRASAHIDGYFMSHRYISYLNDTKVPDYYLANLGAAYVLGDRGWQKRVTFEFNVYNLFNHPYIATVGENGNPISGDYQTFLIGAPRQYFGTVRVTF